MAPMEAAVEGGMEVREDFFFVRVFFFRGEASASENV